MPKNTKTLPRTFATFSPQGCSSVASGFASAYLRSRAFAALSVVTLYRPCLREARADLGPLRVSGVLRLEGLELLHQLLLVHLQHVRDHTRGLLEAEASVAASALHPLHHVAVSLRHRHGRTLKLAGEAHALRGDGLDPRLRLAVLSERDAQSRQNTPPLLAPLDLHDDEGVLDLAPGPTRGPHDERELRGPLSSYLAVERRLAAELGVRCD